MCEVLARITQQAFVYCTSIKRECARDCQQSHIYRLVCIVRVLAVSLQSAHNRLSVRVITVSVRSVLNNRATRLSVFTSNKRRCPKRAQQSRNRLVCIVRVITVSVRRSLNNRTTSLSVFTRNNRECAKVA